MSKKTLTPSAKFVTARDTKGIKFIDVVAAAYNKTNLTDKEAQRVNEAVGLSGLVDQFIDEHRYEVPPILKLVGKASVSSAKRFVAMDVFTRGNGFYLWNNFKQYFLGKVEKDIGDATITIHRLEKSSVDAQIRKELGENREETKLVHFYDLLKKQSQGQKGHLLVNGYANIAYIRDEHDNLWAVEARWSSGFRFWRVVADSVTDPREWRVGYQLLSSDC